jgi:hypothetical protein
MSVNDIEFNSNKIIKILNNFKDHYISMKL